MKGQYMNNMQFTENLLLYLCERKLFDFKVLWYPELAAIDIDKETCYPAYYFNIFWAVYFVINENIDDIQECYDDFRNDMVQQSTADDIDDARFTRCALKIAPLFFSKGYSHGSFLAYCGMVIGVGYHFLQLKPNCIPQRACQVVAQVLFTHQMTGQFYDEGGWKDLLDTSKILASCEDESKKQYGIS